ncbi:MAG: protein of unknown function rane lipoprotein [Firmicutes bacterium]|nr:protein of unknown function rane lipoprotein [Bacillota bacterium]
MKQFFTFLLCAAVLAAVPQAAAAAPTVYGTTGMIGNPSADVLRDGQFSLGYFRMEDTTTGTLAVSVAEGLEVGAANFHNTRQGSDTLLNVKYSLLSEQLLKPGLAIGAENSIHGGQRSLFAVASKGLPFGMRIHVGAGNGRFDGVFAGLEKTWNPLSAVTGNNVFPATTLLLEFDGHRMNYGARLALLPGLKMDAGWYNHHFYTGVTFTK